MLKKKFLLITTIPLSLKFFSHQIRELDKIFDVTLVSSPGDLLDKISISEGVSKKELKMEREISLFKDLVSLFNFIIYFIRTKPYVIHCNTPKASLLALIAGFITRVPVRIYYIHGLRYQGCTGIKKKLLLFFEKVACFCSNHIIAVSEGVRREVESNLSSKKVELIHYGSPNGIEPTDYTVDVVKSIKLKKSLGLSEDDFVFGFLGRITKDKGINELIEAFGKIIYSFPGCKLLLVGPMEYKLDPLSETTLQAISNNPNILSVGYQSDVASYLYIMDVFVSPSYREGFGQTLLEASLLERPIIATDIIGYNEIITNNINGKLVQPKDVNELYNSMLYFINNKENVKLMGINAKTIVEQKYNHVNVLDNAIKHYKSILKNV